MKLNGARPAHIVSRIKFVFHDRESDRLPTLLESIGYKPVSVEYLGPTGVVFYAHLGRFRKGTKVLRIYKLYSQKALACDTCLVEVD